MSKLTKGVLALMALPLLMLFSGCNSEGAFNSEPSEGAKLVEITVTPSPISVLEDRTQQLVAMAKYDDESEKDVSRSVTWVIVGDPTVASVSSSGLLTGNTKGTTELTASKGGITSDTVTVNVCDLADACLDIFDTGSGKLFTNSPSVAYLNSIGGSATDGNYTENGTYGPAGSFYRFAFNNANALCATYNTHGIGERTNWRLATRDELRVELFDASGDMFSARGWPTSFYYWSGTPDGLGYYAVHLFDGTVDSILNINNALLVSCVSEP